MLNRRKFLHRESKSQWRSLVCWLVCLAVWRGPIPMVHDHACAGEAVCCNPLLAEHVAKYHANFHSDRDEGHGPHFHLVLASEFDSLPHDLHGDGADGDALTPSWLDQFVRQDKALTADTMGLAVDPLDSTNWPCNKANSAMTLSVHADRYITFERSLSRSFLSTYFSGASSCSMLQTLLI